ncbi:MULTISPECIES: transposase [Streptomyces]|uniref:Transposase n=1 Tax=Streptomyces sp. NBC_00093 TaxID=2975649 RepID=A0AAU2ACX9_9ACTN
MSLPSKGLPAVPEQTAAVARAAFPKGSLPIRVRDRLAEVFADEPFVDAFGVRGAPGMSPAVLSLVTVLQFAENLTDRQAAAMAVRAIDWKYAIGAELTDTGFDHTVLTRFRTRLVGHGLERAVFDRLVAHCRDVGLIGAGGKQRTEATHVISAVRDLNRLELAGESVRAALEALAVAAPAWLAGEIDVAEFAHRYGPRFNGWTMRNPRPSVTGWRWCSPRTATRSARPPGRPPPPPGSATSKPWPSFARSWCRPTTDAPTRGDGR